MGGARSKGDGGRKAAAEEGMVMEGRTEGGIGGSKIAVMVKRRARRNAQNYSSVPD